MFVTDRQIYFYLESVFIGVLCGGAYLPFYLIKIRLKKNVSKTFMDFSFVIPCCAIYYKFVALFAFPDFRLYMAIGTATGFLIENYGFNKTLAFCFYRVYNKIIKIIRRNLTKKRRKHNVEEKN